MKRLMNKKVATIGLAAGLALGAAGAAFAYFTATGSGTGQATTGSSSAMTLIQDSTVVAAQLVPGVPAQTITGHQYNSAGTTEFVGAVTPSITGVTETNAAKAAYGDPADSSHTPGTSGLYYVCSALDYTLTSSAAAGDETSGPNAVQATSSANDFSLGTIAFNDSHSVDQSACEGATLALSFSS